MLTGEQKYQDWLLDYVDAWLERMPANGSIIPTNVGLDGTIGGECEREMVRRHLRLGVHCASPADRRVRTATAYRGASSAL